MAKAQPSPTALEMKQLLLEAREYIELFTRGEGEATDLLARIDAALNRKEVEKLTTGTTPM